MSSSPAETTASQIWNGLRSGAVVIAASAPFGMLFGALAVKQGLTSGEAVAMSAMVFAGASQMVGLELYGGAVLPWLVVLSIFAVNFRHVLYSAALGPRMRHWPWWQFGIGYFLLTDVQFAEAERRAEAGRPITFAWYMALGLAIYAGWVIQTWIGTQFGRLITDPRAFALDFILPLYFLGMVIGFRKRPFWLPVTLASAIGSIVAYKTVGSPWHVSIGACFGVLVAAAFDPSTKGVDIK